MYNFFRDVKTITDSWVDLLEDDDSDTGSETENESEEEKEDFDDTDSDQEDPWTLEVATERNTEWDMGYD